MEISNFVQKHPIFKVLRNKVIRHMWRVANGLDNAGLVYKNTISERTPYVLLENKLEQKK